ncbi:DNA cytosine methyltransferase [Ralstonia pseudosolanacearum]|uniref:DNA (cytosine-5-)-methyltransferase n=2 Tax=Ralstonia pseudosolanacearum TaxID=1310165 RepID=A0A454TKI2_9RALS|nr:DNA cytosine methyltransferase [Ralstonia pseudosolanacearum]RAA07210.1 DNA (cytosine-5-)-methyltransferase [Ralstonia pseudosolanacearum]RNM02309.1 DNA (cytosine-5-)-methyltransferase [Ralstonia pseudosolanacearum]
MDLFSGCGGISLGFATAGFEPVASVEFDQRAAESHGANFAGISHGKNHAAHYRARDITQERPASIFRDIGLTGPVDQQVDVLVGGPPCQAFARVGRAKLRHEARRREEITADSAFLVDGRVNLWQHYLAYVRETKPLALLMENVPDILNHGGTNVAEVVAEELRKEGYVVRYTLLNAAWYGVPQMRERMFLIGVHKDLNAEVSFPGATHFTVLPPGYGGTRATARKLIPQQGLEFGTEHGHHWMEDPLPGAGLPTTTPAGEALADLPPIYALDLLASGGIKRGQKNPAEPVTYSSATATTAWSHLMRQWPRFGTTDHSTGHVIRYLPRDYKIFQLMEEGWQYPEVWRFVEEKRQQLLEGLWRKGKGKTADNAQVERLIRDWTLPYDPQKFPNKWWKLYRDKPVRTLMAHLGKDSYSHIHFDSAQARPISVREAARLQSFPDGFILRGSMNAAFKQIGNAVPPLVAYAIAMEMRSMIGCLPMTDMRDALLGLNRRHATATGVREDREKCVS